MEFFDRVASVRLKSCCYDKYLCAKDERLVCQERDTNEKGTIWSVEKVASTGFNNDDDNSVRIKSVNGMYLTALEVALLFGDKGNKVQQTYSSKADSAVEWEPIQVGKLQLKLKTKRGTYLRANGGIPPYKNSVTHNGTKKDSPLNSFLWEVEVVEYLTDKLAIVENKGTSQSPMITSLKKMEHESIPAKIGSTPDYLQHHISAGRRHHLSLEHVQEFVMRSAMGSIPSDDVGDSYIGERTPHESSESRSSRPISSDGSADERGGTRIIPLDDEREDKVRTQARPGPISPEGTQKGTKMISSYARGQTVRTHARNREHGPHPVSLEGTEHGTGISLGVEREDKARNPLTPHARDGRPGVLFSSEGIEQGVPRTSSDERERIVRTPRNRDHGILRLTSFDGGDGRGIRISSDDEREDKVRTPHHRDHGRSVPISSSEGTRHATRISSDGEIDHGTRRISSDGEIENRLRTTAAARDRQVRLQPPTSSKDGEHHESRISSDEREQRFRTHQDRERGMTRLPISPADVKEQRRVMSPRDGEYISSTSRLRIATDDRDLNAFPHEGRGSKILSNDEEHNSASSSSDYEHRHLHRIPFHHKKEHKFFSNETEREESPFVASPGHRLSPSSSVYDDGAEQLKRMSHERKPLKIIESAATRYRDSALDIDEERKLPKVPPLTPRSPSLGSRRIFFTMADAHGKYSTLREESFSFKGNNVNDLKQELLVHTKMEEDIFVFLRNESDGTLFNLRLTLPPCNVPMHVVVARVNSEGRSMKLLQLQLREDTFQNHRKGVCNYMRDTRYVFIFR
ncbi:unnamed protein product [Sphagnum troendelagicum]|uniref:DUF569 domain-containing protein n=1 Tax=Sphagnum troendelagicum TaxID=128251 RepID=A0ABP0TZX9_9BRYO